MAEDFPTRFGYEQAHPKRDFVERDSPRMRALIWEVASRGGNLPGAGYKAVSRAVGILPSSDIWSDKSSSEAALRIIEDLSWVDVFIALENLVAGAPRSQDIGAGGSGLTREQIQSEVNAVMVRDGLAYEMRNGRFEFFDPEAEKLGIRGLEIAGLESLTDEFAPVRAQYQKAIDKLNARPADLEGAVADAVNALEAVAGIVAGRTGVTLGDLSKALFPNGEGYHQPLRDAISKLYGYSSAVPGVRHGRYAEPLIAYAETVMVVRIAGAIISFLITDFRAR